MWRGGPRAALAVASRPEWRFSAGCSAEPAGRAPLRRVRRVWPLGLKSRGLTASGIGVGGSRTRGLGLPAAAHCGC